MGTNNVTRRRTLFSLARYVWRLAIPFWMFRDAYQGGMEQRIANYRYNRERRRVLPFYVWKWVGIAICMMQLTRILSDLMSSTSPQGVDYMCATVLCMSAGIGFAFACIVIVLLAAIYVYLSCVER